MNLERLYQILKATTVMLRKGPEVEEREVGNVHVTEIFAMPHKSEYQDSDMIMVDCHFIVVAVDKAKAEKYREELIAILKEYPAPDRLAGGPSYIEVGAEIGDQGAAFRLFALGEALGLWSVFTPKTLGFTGPLANEMAGSGMVMISGFKAPQ